VFVALLRTLVPHFSSSFGIDFEEEFVNVCLLLESEEEGKKISHNFKSYANFPYSLGRLDGKHIHIIRNSLQ
jgi:hypothetical protein